MARFTVLHARPTFKMTHGGGLSPRVFKSTASIAKLNVKYCKNHPHGS